MGRASLKAVPKANPMATANAKVQAKAKAKAQAKVQAKAKAKAQAKANVKSQAKAKVKAKAKAQVPPKGPDPKDKNQANQDAKASRGGAKGWTDIVPGATTLGKLGAMAVTDHLKSLAKKGNQGPLDHYKTLKGPEKIDFALQLKVDREAAFLTCKETHSLETVQESHWITGWVTDALVAKEEGLFNYNTDPVQKAILDALLADLPSRPHERPSLAAIGVKQYDYSAKKLTKGIQRQVDAIQTEAKVDMKQEDHDKVVQMVQNIENAMGSQAANAKNLQATSQEITLHGCCKHLQAM